MTLLWYFLYILKNLLGFLHIYLAGLMSKRESSYFQSLFSFSRPLFHLTKITQRALPIWEQGSVFTVLSGTSHRTTNFWVALWIYLSWIRNLHSGPSAKISKLLIRHWGLNSYIQYKSLCFQVAFRPLPCTVGAIVPACFCFILVRILLPYCCIFFLSVELLHYNNATLWVITKLQIMLVYRHKILIDRNS